MYKTLDTQYNKKIFKKYFLFDFTNMMKLSIKVFCSFMLIVMWHVELMLKDEYSSYVILLLFDNIDSNIDITLSLWLLVCMN